MKETTLLASLVVLCGYYALFALVFGLFRRVPVESVDGVAPAVIRIEAPTIAVKPKTAYWTAKPSPSAQPTVPDPSAGDD